MGCQSACQPVSQLAGPLGSVAELAVDTGYRVIRRVPAADSARDIVSRPLPPVGGMSSLPHTETHSSLLTDQDADLGSVRGLTRTLREHCAMNYTLQSVHSKPTDWTAAIAPTPYPALRGMGWFAAADVIEPGLVGRGTLRPPHLTFLSQILAGPICPARHLMSVGCQPPISEPSASEPSRRPYRMGDL